MSLSPKLSILLIVFINISIASQKSNILSLNIQTLPQALTQYQYLLAYFYDRTCEQCKIATAMFHTLHALTLQLQQQNNNKNNKNKESQIFKLDRDKVQFAQVALQGNQDLFKKYKIQAVPQIRMYANKNKHKTKDKDLQQIKIHSYNLIQYKYQNLYKLAVWTKRISEQYFPKVQSSDQLSNYDKYVIVDCKQQQLIRKLKQIYIQYLSINFVCATNSKQNLKYSKVLLKQQKQSKILQKCFTKNKQKYDWSQSCTNNIINFEHRGILRWQQQFINKLYNKNYSIIVLITSNESVSHDYLRNLTKIKDKLDSNQKQLGNKLPIFTVADIHYDLQSTMRLKKFIGGYDIKGWPYPYPILAYLELDGQGKMIKYIYQLRQKQVRKTQITIQQWIQKARKHELQRYYRGMNLTKEMDLIKDAGKNIYKIYLSQLLQLRERYRKQQSPTPKKPSMYLYVYWKVNWEMQVLGDEMRGWWTQASNAKYSGVLYHFDLYDNQLPPDVQINLLPAIVTFYYDGTFEVHENVKNIGEVQQIFKDANKKYRSANKQKDKLKAN